MPVTPGTPLSSTDLPKATADAQTNAAAVRAAIGAMQDSTSAVLEKLAGATPEAGKIGEEYLPESLDGQVTLGNYDDFHFHSEQIVIADGPDEHGRRYHAFPSFQKIGNEYWVGYMTSYEHADRRGDMIFKKSTDCRNWTEAVRFAATKPNKSNALALGDIEYRAGAVNYIGNGVMIIILHQYEVVSLADLLAASGNWSAYSISRDNGKTWSTPVRLPRFATGKECTCGFEGAVWGGYFYCAGYSRDGDPYQGIYRAPVASLRAGVVEWQLIARNVGQEPVCWVDPKNPSELVIWGRSNGGYVSQTVTTDAVDFTLKNTYFEHPARSIAGTKPAFARTSGGKWIFPIREMTDTGSGGSLRLRVLVGGDPLPIYSGDGQPLDELWPKSEIMTVPSPVSSFNSRAWNGCEKNLYFGLVPEKGDMTSAVFAIQPQEQNDGPSNSGGWRSSVFYSVLGSGSGETPLGPFEPAQLELLVPTVDMTKSYRSAFFWMTANTNFALINGPQPVTLELFGDFTPTFSVGGTNVPVTGSMSAVARNIAIIETGPTVRIVNAAPMAPTEIASLKGYVLGQFSPSGIRNSGSNITSWLNEGKTSYVASLVASATPPTLTTSANGKPCVQGAELAHFTNAGGNTWLSALYVQATCSGATWAGSFETIIPNALQGQAQGAATWQTGAPWATYQRFRDGVGDSSPAAPTTGWANYAMRQRDTTDNANQAAMWSQPANASLLRVMGQDAQASRGWRGKVSAILMLQSEHYVTNREDYLIRRWMRAQ